MSLNGADCRIVCVIHSRPAPNTDITSTHLHLDGSSSDPVGVGILDSCGACRYINHFRPSLPRPELYLQHSIRQRTTTMANVRPKESYNLEDVVKDNKGKMEYTYLGKSGLRVSKICLGMMS